MPPRQMKPEELLAMANDADLQFERAKDEREKARWRDIANGYRDLAKSAKEMFG